MQRWRKKSAEEDVSLRSVSRLKVLLYFSRATFDTPSPFYCDTFRGFRNAAWRKYVLEAYRDWCASPRGGGGGEERKGKRVSRIAGPPWKIGFHRLFVIFAAGWNVNGRRGEDVPIHDPPGKVAILWRIDARRLKLINWHLETNFCGRLMWSIVERFQLILLLVSISLRPGIEKEQFQPQEFFFVPKLQYFLSFKYI